MAIGGAFLTMSRSTAFSFDDRCRAAAGFASPSSYSARGGRATALLGAILFAAFDALQIRIQQTPLGAGIPYQVFLMMPYFLSILALVAMSRRAEVPAALMVPFNKGER